MQMKYINIKKVKEFEGIEHTTLGIMLDTDVQLAIHWYNY